MKLAIALALLIAVETRAAADEAPVAKMFKIEHQNPDTVARALRYLLSGDHDTKLEPNEGLGTIVVRDRPSNVAAIEQAIKQIDVARPDVTFQVRVLLASREGETSVPPDMQKVVRQLQQNLQFKSYQQLAAMTQRVTSGARVESKGTIQLGPPVTERPVRAGCNVELRPVVSGEKRGSRTIQLRSLRFELESREAGKAEIRTDIVVPEGETVVVGTAALGARALVLVVWAQVG